ncbi:MAG: hypothetical protein AAFP04_15430 [Myxococcota bacterium]
MDVVGEALNIISILLWRAAGLVTALVAGYLTSHVIVLGRYFDWLVAHDHAALLQTTYSAFRLEADPVTPYLGSFFVQFFLAVALLIIALRHRSTLGIPRLAAAVLAAGALPLTIAVFSVTGFYEVEQRVMAATDLSPETLDTWLKLNVPLHVASAMIFIVAAMALVFVSPPEPSSGTKPKPARTAF